MRTYLKFGVSIIGVFLLLITAIGLGQMLLEKHGCAKGTGDGNRATSFMIAADDKASCTSWGASSGSSSVVTDSAWCDSDHVWFYCTGGAPRFEKDEHGAWVNLNEPQCKAKLNKAPPPPAPAPAPAPAPTPAPAPAAAPTPAPAPMDAGSAG